MDYFENLSDEIVIKIFSYLSMHTVRCVLPLVCRRWKQLSCDYHLWSCINVSSLDDGVCANSAASLKKLLSCSPFICSISCTRDVWGELPIDYQNNIQSLEITSWDKDFPLLTSFLSLKKLTLRNLAIFNRKKNGMCQRHVSLHIEKLFMNIMKYAIKLTHLSVDYALHDRDIKWIIQLQNISHLNICIDQLSPGAITSLQNLPYLNKLFITDANMTLEKLRSLKQLPLRKAELCEQFTSPVFHINELFLCKDSAIRTLRQLTLVKCHIGDKTAELIRLNCSHLNYLEIKQFRDWDEDRLTEKGLVHLLHLEHLRFLEVTGYGKDWCLRRDSWKSHTCDAYSACPLGLPDLLKSWRDIPLIID